ncbi:hypothetical protein KDL44_02860 [bacterium]|nr:hypothetical protein [bacterium]
MQEREITGLALGDFSAAAVPDSSNEQAIEMLSAQLEGRYLLLQDSKFHGSSPISGRSQLLPSGVLYERQTLVPASFRFTAAGASLTVLLAIEDPYARYYDGDRYAQNMQLLLQGSINDPDWQDGDSAIAVGWNTTLYTADRPVALSGDSAGLASRYADWYTGHAELGTPQRILVSLIPSAADAQMPAAGPHASSLRIKQLLAGLNYTKDADHLFEFRLNDFGGYELVDASVPDSMLLGRLGNEYDILQYGQYQLTEDAALVELDESLLRLAWQEIQPMSEFSWPLVSGAEYRLRPAEPDMRSSAAFSLPSVVLNPGAENSSYLESELQYMLHFTYDWADSRPDTARRRSWHFGELHANGGSGPVEDRQDIILAFLSANMQFTIADPATELSSVDRNDPRLEDMQDADWPGIVISSQPDFQLSARDGVAGNLALSYVEQEGTFIIGNTMDCFIRLPEGNHARIHDMRAELSVEDYLAALGEAATAGSNAIEAGPALLVLEWQIGVEIDGLDRTIHAGQDSWITY